MSDLWKVGTFSDIQNQVEEDLAIDLFFAHVDSDEWDSWFAHSEMISLDDISDFLEHHGIKGQKWGVRRYQNEDGSLTAAGKARYGNGDGGETIKVGKNMRKEARRNFFKNGTVVKSIVGGALPGGLYGAGTALALGRKVPIGKRTYITPNGTTSEYITRAVALDSPEMKSMVKGFGTTMSVLGAGAGALTGYNFEKRFLKKESRTPDEISKMDAHSKIRKQAESGSLAKAADNPTSSYANTLRNWINKKITNETKNKLSAFDKELDYRSKRYETVQTKRERKDIQKDTMAQMNAHAKEILKDMGWEVTPQNMYYLTQVIWQSGN